MGEDKPATGRCLCGSVRYQCEGNLGPAHYCHCEDCRRCTGSINVAVRVDAHTFKIIAGSPRGFAKQADSGKSGRVRCKSRCLLRANSGHDRYQFNFPDFWESPEAQDRSSSTRPLIASSSDASAERDVGHQAFQLSRIGLRDGLEIPYTEAIHTRDRSGGTADMTFCGNPLSRSLSGVKRTWVGALHMSACDPKQTCRFPKPFD